MQRISQEAENDPHRILRFGGTHREIGVAHGRSLGADLATTIEVYLGELVRRGVLDVDRLHHGALDWVYKLPDFYLEEIEGLAEGSGIPLEDVARFYYAELCHLACSSVVHVADGRVWVARNNDAEPFDGLWGYVVIRDVAGRIPTLAIGLKGDVFIVTGINRERLWLHHNYLEAYEPPADEPGALPSWGFVRAALETCTSIDEVEQMLSTWTRLDGMNLTVVDGKTQDAAVLECSRSTYRRRALSGSNLVATNHYVARDDIDQSGFFLGTSVARFNRLIECVAESPRSAPDDLIAMLADRDVEQNREGRATVYSVVACPADGRMWWAYDATPAASRGSWNALPWPW